jgi:hypothetical protein
MRGLSSLSERAGRIAPEARGFADPAALLREAPEVEAVFVATPTDRHREIVEACLAAGKHVFCEAPLAASSPRQRPSRVPQPPATGFAAGHQLRANPHFDHALKFLKVRAVGGWSADGGHWHSNTSWQRTVTDPSFMKEMNWQLDPNRSLGLFGEAGVHFSIPRSAPRELPIASAPSDRS